MNSTFKTDLTIGEQFELQIRDYLNNISDCDCIYKKIEGYFIEYDLKCEHCNTTIEVKHDKKSVYTGNLVFERSLFTKSKAEYIAYKHWWTKNSNLVDDVIAIESGLFWLFKRDSFIRLANKYMDIKKKSFIRGGDVINGEQNLMLIVPIDDLPLYFYGSYRIIDMKYNKRGIN